MTATMTRGLLACPPRVGTERTSRPTLGPRLGEIAARLNTPLMPWQQHVVDVAYEQNPDGSLVYSEVVLEVGRQEGKTALKFVAMVDRLVAMVTTHGAQRVTYTMQNRVKARTRLERDYAVRLRGARGFKEIDAKTRARPTRQNQWRLGMNSGVEHIQFGTASYMQIDTPSRTGSHGDTLDAGFIDEAFAHWDDTVELGMEPALLIPSDSQMWVLSAAGDAKSRYLWRKVLSGRKLVEDGCDFGSCYFEWSAPDDADPGDPDVWAAACPALGITHADGSGLTEAKLAARWEAAQRKGQEGIDLFRRAYLCQWPEVPVLGDEPAFKVIPQDRWADCEDVYHKPVGRLSYALDLDTNARGEEWCSVAMSDGVHVELVTPIDATEGTGWVIDAVKAKRDLFGDGLLIDPAGPAGKLVAPLEQADVPLRKLKGQEIAQASMHFTDKVSQLLVRHIGQTRLNVAVAGVTRKDVGDGAYRFSRSYSTGDISPLMAAAFATFGALSDEGPSMYEDRPLTTL